MPPFAGLKKCGHFEWLDAYIERLQLKGSISATRELDLGWLVVEPVEKNLADRSVPVMSNAEFNGELKKLRQQLKQLIDLKKQ